jgi:hypothetical protein
MIPTLLRDVPANSAYFGIYELTRRWLTPKVSRLNKIDKISMRTVDTNGVNRTRLSINCPCQRSCWLVVSVALVFGTYKIYNVVVLL